MEQELIETVDRYIEGLFVADDPALQAAVASSVEAGLPQIHVTPGQGKFLYLLARLCRARRILEIGTLAGYSAIWLARALPDDGRLVSL
ncbi:MAG: O-methyltransferase, partial [Planctomycetota bacterium]